MKQLPYNFTVDPEPTDQMKEHDMKRRLHIHFEQQARQIVDIVVIKSPPMPSPFEEMLKGIRV